MSLGEYESGYFVNNTVFHPPSSNARAITFASHEDSLWLVANNIVWNEEGNAALHLDVENDSILIHNVLGARTGDAPSVEHDNLRMTRASWTPTSATTGCATIPQWL